MSGGSLATKGLAGGGGGAAPASTTLPALPTEPVQLESAAPHGTVVVVIPTAVNVILMAAENIVDNVKTRNAASLTLPSMYKRAYLIAYETDEIAVAKEQ